ncbi:MAG: phosphoribosyl-ATP diphosphatase [Proteobacteria bacterium]|nr:phosphoribosyl-ATP diphosphatase [Pseudomonadota bacterium]NBP15547.1 phosphoribosyl-ATP diphosphatase [bacterium]
MNTKLDVATFMKAGSQNVEIKNPGYYPSRIDQANLYFNLIKEEYSELATAVENNDIIETADACADLIWVVEGLMYSLGIDPQIVWEEVAKSNFSKTVDGKLIKREDGKVLKPESFKPPNIQRALGL